MKICYLADAQSVHVQKWARYFSDEGNEVHIISFRDASIKGAQVHYINPRGTISISPISSFISKIGYLFWIGKVKKIINKIRPEILHAHWATSYGLLGALSGFHPFLLSTWGNDIIISPQKNIIFRKLVEYSLKKADLVTATSSMLSDATSELIYDNKPVYTIPFGVDVNLFSPSKEKRINSTIRIGIVKALEEKYGIEYLIKAFKIIQDKCYKSDLLIVGEGSLRDDLENLSNSLNLSDSVSFLGKVENNLVVESLRKMDIFVAPSISPSETFGVAVVEASSCSIPVIASNIGGLPEVVNDGITGFLVPPRDENAIADRIIRLIDDPKLRLQMGIEGRDYVKSNYDMQICGNLMKEKYEGMLQG